MTVDRCEDDHTTLVFCDNTVAYQHFEGPVHQKIYGPSNATLFWYLHGFYHHLGQHHLSLWLLQ